MEYQNWVETKPGSNLHLMIHSTRDEYVPVEGAKRLFSVAQEPKRFLLIEARNHRFEGNQEQFFGRLREGLEWINQMSD